MPLPVARAGPAGGQSWDLPEAVAGHAAVQRAPEAL